MLIEKAVEHEPKPEAVVSEEQRQKEWLLRRKTMYDRIPVGISEIISGFLWLGSCRDAKKRSLLADLGITHIFNCALEWKPRSTNNFIYKCGNILDSPTQDLSLFLAEAFEFLDEARRVPNQRVFVHCVAGKSRSATLTIAYLMRNEKLTLKQAYCLVKSRRPLILPNDGFMRQLLDFELQLYGYNTMTWGEWKDQTKCALSPPLPNLTPDEPLTDTTINNNNTPSSINSNNHINTTANSNNLTNSPINQNNLTNTSTNCSNSNPASNPNNNTTNNNRSNPSSPRNPPKTKRSPLQKEALDLFLKTHITPEFLQQGVQEVCGGALDMANMPDLLQWVNRRIRLNTSSGEEVRVEGLSWKDVSHSIDKSAKNWLRSQAGAVTSAE